MSGQHWRFAIFVGAGLLALPTLYLLTSNWSVSGPNGDESGLEADGLAGAIGFWPLFVTLIACALAMAGALFAEVHVRRRTERRRPRDEYERYRP
jgi:hypothetical protein